MEAEVDLLSYCAREWKGDTPRAKLMRKVCPFVEVMENGECVCVCEKVREQAFLSALWIQ